jgi:hypothetical protein
VGVVGEIVVPVGGLELPVGGVVVPVGGTGGETLTTEVVVAVRSVVSVVNHPATSAIKFAPACVNMLNWPALSTAE